MEDDSKFLESIKIINFRSIQKVDITHLPQILGIRGPNGSGKSNLLQAIYLFSKSKMNIRYMQKCFDEFHIKAFKDIIREILKS